MTEQQLAKNAAHRLAVIRLAQAALRQSEHELLHQRQAGTHNLNALQPPGLNPLQAWRLPCHPQRADPSLLCRQPGAPRPRIVGSFAL